MSCDRWNELVGQGESLLREGSPEREAAERHFRSCPSCCARAFLLDPSWAVRSAPRLEGSSGIGAFDEPGRAGQGDIEVADLKRRILEAGRMRAVEGSVRRVPVSMGRAAAAVLVAAILAGGVWFRTSGGFRGAGDSARPAPAAQSAANPPASNQDPFTPSAAAELSLPAIGSLAPASARIYDLGQEDFALVMVVHETLDL